MQALTRIFIIAVTICLLAAPLSSTWADENTNAAAEVVQQFQAELLSAMKNADKLGFQGRYNKLKPAVEQSHDLEGIARIAVGRYWKDFSEAQRQTLIDAFSQLSIATYANRFDGFSGEKFKTVSDEKQSRGDQLVRTLLIKSDGEEIHLDYVLRDRDGQWKIINIIAEGVSDLGIKRAEYSRILVTQDFDTLIERLMEKIERNSQPDETF